MMKFLWFLFLLHTTFGQTGFGRSYLRKSTLCHQWSCINNKLNLPDGLPPAEQFSTTLRALLPPSWQGLVDPVVYTCYNDRPRRYTNTCPAQALLQCAVDQLVYNCPEHSLRKDDACAPVNSLAGGLKYMFSQSRYENMQKNIHFEKRPAWFLKHYFDSKCCNLPPLFNSTTLTECGFTTMMMYIKHDPQLAANQVTASPIKKRDNIFNFDASNNGEIVRIASLDMFAPKSVEKNIITSKATDPLDCIDIAELIKPEWRRECGFELRWSGQDRLTISDADTKELPTATVRTVTHRDLVVLPHTCEKSTCVFDKLNITSSGTVNQEAFKKILDNMTDSHPIWNKAKARVLTSCLTKPLRDEAEEYDDDCEINKILSCTFDVLSENCPLSESSTKHDACKHSKDARICQISSSKTRPKNRRSACVVPELVEKTVLSECGLQSLHKVEEIVRTVTKPKKVFAWQHQCQDLTRSTSCLMAKMGILNKYGFIDYFRTKDMVRDFARNSEWSNLSEVFLGSFSNGPLYTEHCNSAKKLLNVLDALLISCPDSKRATNPQCTKLLTDIMNTPTKQHSDQVLQHFHQIYSHPPQKPIMNRPQLAKVIKKPIYDYGVLGSSYEPIVKIIDVNTKVDKTFVKKQTIEKSPMMLLPVYMRPHSNLAYRPVYQNGMLRSPFKEIYKSHLATAKASSKPVSSSIFTSTHSPASYFPV